MRFLYLRPLTVVPFFRALDAIRVARSRQQRRQPVVMLDDLVAHRARRNAAGPADQLRNTESAFPVRVLLAAERRHARIRPAVHVRAVVGGIDDDGVFGQAQFVQQVQHLPDVPVVVDHCVVVRRLVRAGLPDAFGLGVRDEMHVRGVEPHEERLAGLVLALDEIAGGLDELVVAGFHALARQRSSVLDLLPADLAPARVGRGIVLVARPAMDDTARTELLAIARVLRIAVHLRLFFGVEVVEVPEELIETVQGGQVLVQIAQMVLAELTRRVTAILQQRGDGHHRIDHALRRAGNAHLRQPRAMHALPRDERGAPRGTALLAI
ncbi:hypothetical protein ABIE51_002263 [Lysobacter sp. OAE881]